MPRAILGFRTVTTAFLSFVVLQGCLPMEEEVVAAPTGSDREQAIRLIEWSGVTYSAIGDEGSYEIVASSAIYRKRVSGGGLITYHSLADLVILNGSFSIELKNSGGFSSIPASIASLLSSADAEFRAADDISSGDTAETQPIVTRLILKEPRIRLATASSRVSLESDSGHYDIRSGTLELVGDVVIRTAEGGILRGPKAVLSEKHNGLYLPMGFTRRERFDPRSAFAVLDDQGRLSTTRGTRRISYEDLIESRERLVIMHYAEHAPAALRPILIALLAGMRASAP